MHTESASQNAKTAALRLAELWKIATTAPTAVQRWTEEIKMADNALPELPYERTAMAGGEMPNDLEWYDRQMFLMLRTLYWQYKQGIVDRETASREKARLLQDYDLKKFQEDFTKDIAQKIMDTEQARQTYRKNRTLENADAIILAFEGVPVTFNEEAL
jgi:hypothetical protein